MSTTLPTLLAHELRLQYRYGIHAAYAVVVALYVTGLLALGEAAPSWFVGILIYSDPAVLGYFFLGGLMLLEKGEGIRAALAISPVTAGQYLASKTITLTGLAILAVIAIAGVKASTADWPLLLTTVALTSINYIAIGIVVALRFRTVNTYLIGSAALLLPIVGPSFLALLNPMPLALAVLPTVSQLRLTLVALGFGSAHPVDIFVMLAIATISAIMAVRWARSVLAVELGRK